MEGLVTMTELKTGLVDVIDLLKLNALLDMKAGLEQREMERSRNTK
jgi:hypothetical protein